MKHTFQGEGPHEARLAVVCEKPDRDEIAAGRLLAGTSGRRVRNHLAHVGFDAGSTLSFVAGRSVPGRLSRDVWLTNAVQSFDELGTPSVRDIINDQERLWRELDSLPNLTCIIAMGNAALASLTNFHCTTQNKRGELSGIGQWRGSRLRAPFGPKLVPTFHPSFYMHDQWRFQPVVDFDCKRAALEVRRGRALQWPKRTFYIEPASLREAIGWLHDLQATRRVYLNGGPAIAYDIEAQRGRFYRPKPLDDGPWYITCISFSADPHTAYCIPFTRGHTNYWSLDEEIALWQAIQDLFLQADRAFVGQNCMAYDNWVLRQHGLSVPYYYLGFDTMVAHRCLAPDLPHDLGFLTSLYTEEPYYKSESGRGEQFGAVPLRQFWIYGCKDAACTLEVAQGLHSDLRETKQLEFFYREYQSRARISLDKTARGFRVDRTALKEARTTREKEITEREARLNGELGWTPNTKSYIDMGRLLDQYGVRYQRTTKGRPAISEEQLLMYAHRNPHVQRALQSCIDITQRRTLLSNFLQMRLDSDGYYHAIIDSAKTKSGRDSSQGAHEGGPQILNVPFNLRHLFIPDRPDLLLTTGDLKQAEAMFVAWDAQDPFLISAFESGQDIHRIRGAVIFRGWPIDYRRPLREMLPPNDLIETITKVCANCASLGEHECTHSERFIAKQAGHAFNYKMGPRKFVTKILPPAGVFLSEAEGKRLRNLVITPAVSAWHARIDRDLKVSRWLTNPLGQRREFYGIHDEDMLREALAWMASSTVACITGPAERALYERFEGSARYDDCRIVVQWYDSLTIQHPPALTEEIRDLIAKAYRRPVWLHGRQLLIPVDFKTGSNWGFKAPAQLAVEAAA